ncbi:midasin, partial [Pancytospora epiphaga]
MIEKYRLKYQDVLLEELGEVVDVGGIPVVYGSGGKTEILCEKYPEMIVYDSREILEPRNLGGLYVLRDGDLHYIDGILVEAMLTGLLLCFKRIDANIGLLQYLRPVIRDRAITTTNGCTIKAHADFRLAFTALDLFCFKNVTFIGPVGFTYASIMESFGDMRLSVENALGYVKTFKKEKCQAGRGLSCAEICLKEVFSCSCSENGLVCGDHYRMFCGLKSFLLLLKEKGAIDSTNYNRCILYQGLVNYILKHDSERLLGHLHAAQQPLVFPNLNFAKTKAVESTLRGLIGNIQCKQPTLLVGETGAGKTALLQYLCDNSFHFFGMKTELKIINMSSDFDGTLLVGGYQSIDFNAKIKDLYSLAGIEMPALTNRKTLIQHLIAHCERQETINGPNKHIISNLMKVKLDAQAYLKILGQKLAFCFKEGILVKAMREGTWILLDEVNLAPEETLDLLEALLSKKQFLAYESGAKDNFIVHPNFMVFACMNPFGDYGKKHYNTSVFNTLTFYDFSASLDCIKAVIRSISRNLLSGVDAMAEFYYELRKAVCSKKYTNVVEPLITGRTLCRAIDLAVKLESQGHPSSVYSAFSLLFLTQLDLNSRSQALALYKKYLRSFPVKPSMFVNTSSDNRWCGNFVLTPKVCIYLNDVELAVQAGLPVLLQGDTATGKTSLVTALARKHGTRVIRINNHEHTDASEYIGNYTTSQDGVIFKEGPLVLALRTGAWLILDELNLAPSDVLEVLNRLLDDNREIYVPELDEVVKPHPKFRLFGTQNIRYGGRQGLAKSFRNRFVEIFFYEKDNLEL